MTAPNNIHPDVINTFKWVDAVQDKRLSRLDQMLAHTSEGISEDRDIAVKVDMNGQLADLWLKPGLLDRKSAAVIAKEITQLVAAAARESVETVARLFREGDEPPTFEEVLAESDAASPPGEGGFRR